MSEPESGNPRPRNAADAGAEGVAAGGELPMAKDPAEPSAEPSAAQLPSTAGEEAFDSADDRAWFPIVGVGASAGGLDAFTQLLSALPADTGMAFVLVQHLAPSHASALAEILSRATKMQVTEVLDDSLVEPNHVYVIPPGRSLVITKGALRLLPRASHGLHRPVDQFFRALADDRRHQAIGVVLSGTASDGTLGLEAIKAGGGITFAQDASAQHDGMPHSAIASGCVDFVLPPGEIARELVGIGQHPYAAPTVVTGATSDQPDLAQVVQLLCEATGVDFTRYKFNTLYRRVTRRMVLRKMKGLAEYAQYLRQTPAEVTALYEDILISVTSFFRDPEAFATLQSTVFPRLLKDRSRSDPVRLWTIGCSTGQEAYSLAIAFTEAAEAAGSSATLQLFATDLNAASIDRARAGIYPQDIAQDVTPERLRRFFNEVDGGYRISKTIREACVFSRHNILADPPFSRIDLISCRNLLIYMEPVLQQRVMPILHYALKPDGCLWLGGSETIGTYRHLFDDQDRKHKIYTKRTDSDRRHGQFPLRHDGAPRSPFIPIAARPREAADLPREADRVLLTRFAPPGVLVTANLEILQYRGDTSPYLAAAPGNASLSLLKMLREDLLVAVRAAIHRAGKEQIAVREAGLRVKSNGGYREVAVEVIPMKGHGGAKDGGYLILFEQGGEPGGTPSALATAHRAVEPPATELDTTRLERELAATRDYLQSVIEQQEAANEELQSANEEVQSANEELQSTNEELETSKEEIQSSNEELATVNDELNRRNAELHRVNDDLGNLINSVQMAVVMLGPDLRVRRFTPSTKKLLGLIPTDVGRRLVDIDLDLAGLPDLGPLLAQVLATVRPQELEVQDKHSHWYSLRLRPYMTAESKLDGVVVTLVDVDAMKRAHAYTESIVATVHEPLVVLDTSLRVRSASRAFYEVFHTTPADTVGRVVFELGNHAWDLPALRRLLQEILSQGTQFDDFQVECEFEHLGQRTMRLNGRRLHQPDGAASSILLAIEDVTDRKRAERERAVLAAIVDSSEDAILSKNLDGRITSWNAGAVRLFGYTAEEAIGKSGAMLFPAERRDEEDAMLSRIMAGQRVCPIDSVRLRKDGSLVEVSVSTSPLKDAAGHVIGVSRVFRDIAARKQVEMALRESEVRFRRLFEATKDGILLLDAENHTITHVNPFLLDLLGYPVEHFLGKQLWEIGFLRDQGASRAAMQELFEHGSIRYESLPLAGQDGRVHPVEMVASVYQESNHRVVQCTIRDISERSRLEEMLRGQASELSDLHRRKDEFLAMLSHELRSPLAPIATAVQLLALQRGSENRIQGEARAIIERQLGQLKHLVDDLLEVSRITTGRLQLRREPVLVSDIVTRAVETVRPLIEQRRHECTVSLPSLPIWLHADVARLEQVVANLLTNAAKFTDEGGHIWLTVQPEGDQCVLRVRDSGVGIDPVLLPHVFDLFTQGERSLDRSQGGLGIGLALVKRLTELHGGTVEAHSIVGQGSEFVVRLPVVPVDTRQQPATAADPLTKRSLRVLVVDDNVDAAASLSMLLKALGHDVQTALDGLTAVQLALAYVPDAVLLDIGLPGLNGYEVAKQLRQAPTLRRVVLVALTGYGQETDRQLAMAAGFDHHLVKPADFGKLECILASVADR